MSSVVDLAHFALAHVNGGRFRGREILAPRSVAEMHARHVETHDANDQGHGLTFVLDTYKGARRVGHGGLSGTFAGFVRLAPDHGIGVAILYSRWQGFLPAERSIVNGIFDRLLDLPTGPPAPPPVVEVDRTSWERHAGAYAGWWTGLVKITSNDAGLTLEARGGEGHVVPLEPAREHVYVGHPPGRTEPISVGFVPEPDGPTRWIKVDGLVCERLEAGAPAAADPAEWAPYAGTYAGPLDTLTVHAQPGCLTIHSKADAEGVECLPVDAHRFSCKWGLVAFQVAADGSVPSLKAGQRPLQEPFTYTRVPVGA